MSHFAAVSSEVREGPAGELGSSPLKTINSPGVTGEAVPLSVDVRTCSAKRRSTLESPAVAADARLQLFADRSI